MKSAEQLVISTMNMIILRIILIAAENNFFDIVEILLKQPETDCNKIAIKKEESVECVKLFLEDARLVPAL